MIWAQLAATLIGCIVGTSLALIGYLIGERRGWWW